MKKIKIFITILTLYELITISILQITDYCVAVFNLNFCAYGGFKYFLMCILLPCVIGLFMWWIPEISRLFCINKCECKTQNTTEINLKNIVHEIISAKDIEKLITAAIIMGVQKFVANHPKTQETFNNILDVIHRVDKPEK